MTAEVCALLKSTDFSFRAGYKDALRTARSQGKVSAQTSRESTKEDYLTVFSLGNQAILL